MKRLGVRLAAGAAVVLLGILAVAQAQRDRQSELGPEWDLQDPSGPDGPPVPIAGLDGAGGDAQQPLTALPPDRDRRGDSDAAAGPSTAAYQMPGIDGGDPAIQLAAHQEPAAQAPAAQGPADTPSMGFAPGPGFATTQPTDQFAGDAGAFSAADGPAMGFAGAAAPPQEAAAPPQGAAASQPAATLQMPQAGEPNADTMPSFAFPAGPAVDLTFEAEADAAPAGDTDPAETAGSPGPPVPTPTAPLGDDAEPNPPVAEGGPRPATENVLRSGGANEASGAADSSVPPSLQAGGAQASPATAEFAATAGVDSGDAEAAMTPSPGFAAAPQPFAASPYPAAADPNGFPDDASATDNSAAAPQPAAAAQPAARVASADLGALRIDQLLPQPGERRLEGAQAPSIVIHKRAPEEVNVGKPATFVIQVQNVGTAEALDVQIHDVVPAGMRLTDAAPQPQRQGDVLVWALGSVEPGGERSVTMQLVPEIEGELGSVARVTFQAAASVRTVSTRPELQVQQRAPQKVLIGQQLEIEIVVSNTGSGSAGNVMLQADIPEGLEHPKGRQLDNLIGTLGPGQSRTQILRLRAVQAGVTENVVRLGAEDGLTAEHKVQVEVVAPQLQVALEGPTRRFLERQAVYNVSVANTGTANASNVELIAYLDRGFTFVGTEFEGQYDPAQHAVYWSLAELPAGQQGLVPLTLLPVEAGEQAVRLEAMADLVTQVKHEKRVTVDTRAELSFSVADVNDPIETGSETTYEVRVRNSGSRGDTNVQLQLQLPAGMELVSADAPAGTDGKGMVAFEPIKQLDSGQEQVYRIRVKGNQPGTHLIRAVLSSEQSKVPVTKEESTTVYSDR